MDKQIINEKLESLRRSSNRIEKKLPKTLALFQEDLDAQDIIVLNLTRAVQLCVDIGAHIISRSEESPPATMGNTFDVLCELNIIDSTLPTNLKISVGFRNIAVHGYTKLDFNVVYQIASQQGVDFQAFAREISGGSEH
ncbi:MAG: DUF86 domain-containing protein [Arenicellales bacterium]